MKTPAQLKRMKLRNQNDFFGDMFVEFSVEQKQITSSTNEIFRTDQPVPEFDQLATNYFRTWALTIYPTLPSALIRLCTMPAFNTSMARTS